MKKLLLILLLAVGLKGYSQINLNQEYPKRYYLIEDTIKYSNEFFTLTQTDTLELDSTLMDRTIVYMILDSIYSYATYYSGPDTIKVVLLVSDDLSDYTEEELCWYAPGPYVEKGYIVEGNWETFFIDSKKRKFEKTIIWDWRYYEWR